MLTGAVEVEVRCAGEKLAARDIPRRLLRCGLCGAVLEADAGASVDTLAEAGEEALAVAIA